MIEENRLREMLRSARMLVSLQERKVSKKSTTTSALRRDSRLRRTPDSRKSLRRSNFKDSTWMLTRLWSSTNSGKALKRARRGWFVTARTLNYWISAPLTRSKSQTSLLELQITRMMWWQRSTTIVITLTVCTHRRRTTKCCTRRRSSTNRTCTRSSATLRTILKIITLSACHSIRRSIKWVSPTLRLLNRDVKVETRTPMTLWNSLLTGHRAQT